MNRCCPRRSKVTRPARSQRRRVSTLTPSACAAVPIRTSVSIRLSPAPGYWLGAGVVGVVGVLGVVGVEDEPPEPLPPPDGGVVVVPPELPEPPEPLPPEPL